MMVLWVLLMMCCLLLFWRQRFLISPTAIFFVYFAFVFPIPYLVSYLFELPSPIFASPRTIPHDKVSFAFFQIALGLVSFCIGRFFLPKANIRWSTVTFPKSRFVPLIAVSLAMAAAGAVWVLHQIGGIGALVEDSGTVRSGGLRGLGAGTFAVTTLLPTVAQFGLMLAFRNKSRHIWVFLVICGISCLLGGAFGFRGIIFFLLIQVACICHLMTGKAYRRFTVGSLVGLSILIAALGYVRILVTEQGVAAQALLSGNPREAIGVISDTSLTRTRGVEAVVVMTDYMDHANYHYFADNITETFGSAIPSFIMSKDISLSEKIATAVYGPFMMNAGNIRDVYGGASYSLIAEGYWNLGLVGIVLVCASAGYALQVIEFRNPLDPVSFTQVIAYKTAAGAVALFIEVPQLGINGVVITLILNLGILYFLSAKVRLV